MSGDNGNGKIKENLSPQEIIKAMVSFMNNTNQFIVEIKMRLNNQQIDIDKIKKHFKDKESTLIIPK